MKINKSLSRSDYNILWLRRRTSHIFLCHSLHEPGLSSIDGKPVGHENTTQPGTIPGSATDSPKFAHPINRCLTMPSLQDDREGNTSDHSCRGANVVSRKHVWTHEVHFSSASMKLVWSFGARSGPSAGTAENGKARGVAPHELVAEAAAGRFL